MASKKKKEIFLGSFGVDSGQVIITDPCYLKDWTNNEFTGEGDTRVFDYSYNGACNKTLNDKLMGGVIGLGSDGVVASTGYGDGVYPVYAVYENNRIKELSIKFF